MDRQRFHNINIDYFSIEHRYHEYEYVDISLHCCVWRLKHRTRSVRKRCSSWKICKDAK